MEANRPARPDFEQLYDEHFDFVWRNLRRLGVLESQQGDAAQDVFLVVHRRLDDFEPRAPLRSWLYSIVVRVARQHRRSVQRKSPERAEPVEGDWADRDRPGPEQQAADRQALDQLLALLDQLDDEKREAFVLSELEGLSAREIGVILAVNVNTIYARIRAARQKLEAALANLR